MQRCQCLSFLHLQEREQGRPAVHHLRGWAVSCGVPLPRGLPLKSPMFISTAWRQINEWNCVCVKVIRLRYTTDMWECVCMHVILCVCESEREKVSELSLMQAVCKIDRVTFHSKTKSVDFSH